MTTERAIEILDPTHREDYDSLETVEEACRMGMTALEKQIPKKVKPVTRTIQKFKCGVCSHKGEECEHLKEMDGHFEYTDYICPTCGALVSDNGSPRYCWRCGQKFAWEEGGFISDEISISKHTS